MLFGLSFRRDLLLFLPLPLLFLVSSTKETPLSRAASNTSTHHSFRHPSQFIISPLTPIHARSTLCPYSTPWHLQPTRPQSQSAPSALQPTPGPISSNLPSRFAQPLTQFRLTEVSTVIDQKIPGNHTWH
jgi:hypothetical protein